MTTPKNIAKPSNKHRAHQPPVPPKGGGIRVPAARIPEEIQAPFRRRLTLARESLGLTKTEVATAGLSTSTLNVFENHDISTMSLSQLRLVSERIGWSFSEMISYLVGSDDRELTTEGKILSRTLNYMRSLRPEGQEMACDFLRHLVTYDEKKNKK